MSTLKDKQLTAYERLQEARLEKNVSMTELALCCDVTVQALYAIRHKRPSARLSAKIVYQLDNLTLKDLRMAPIKQS